MRKYRYVLIIAAVMLLVFVCACTVGDDDVAPAATPDTAAQPSSPGESPLPEETPEQTPRLPP